MRINRAACHLALGDATACLRDCTAALDRLATPPTTLPSAEEVRKRQMGEITALLRRGAAAVQLGEVDIARDDYQAVLRAPLVAQLSGPEVAAVRADLDALEQTRQ